LGNRLRTSHYSLAEAKLPEFLKEHFEQVSNINREALAKMTFGEGSLDLYLPAAKVV